MDYRALLEDLIRFIDQKEMESDCRMGFEYYVMEKVKEIKQQLAAEPIQKDCCNCKFGLNEEIEQPCCNCVMKHQDQYWQPKEDHLNV